MGGRVSPSTTDGGRTFDESVPKFQENFWISTLLSLTSPWIEVDTTSSFCWGVSRRQRPYRQSKAFKATFAASALICLALGWFNELLRANFPFERIHTASLAISSPFTRTLERHGHQGRSWWNTSCTSIQNRPIRFQACGEEAQFLGQIYHVQGENLSLGKLQPPPHWTPFCFWSTPPSRQPSAVFLFFAVTCSTAW